MNTCKVFSFLKTINGTYYLNQRKGIEGDIFISENKYEIRFSKKDISKILDIIYFDLKSSTIIGKEYKSKNGALTKFINKYGK